MARDEENYQEKLANFQRKNGTSRRKFYENKLANFQVKKISILWAKQENLRDKLAKKTQISISAIKKIYEEKLPTSHRESETIKKKNLNLLLK